MSRLFFFRLLADLVLVASIFILPWWGTLSLATVLVFLFRNFYELMVVGFVIDLAYGGATHARYGVNFFVSLVSLSLFLAVHLLKRRLSAYGSTGDWAR